VPSNKSNNLDINVTVKDLVLILPMLRYRRHRGDMIEVYKILHNIYDKDVTCDILHIEKHNNRRTLT